MTAAPDWIALDWGTTHLRAWFMNRSGEIIAKRESGDGMSGLTKHGFERALLRLIGDVLPDTHPVDVICCGMAGARQGWIEAPYLSVPCCPPGLDQAIRAPTRHPHLSVRILPGVSQATPPDVMRGEETQIAGVLAADPGFDGVICLPGTHCKWAEISGGRIVSFRTFMTGEVFGLLAEQSILRHSVGATDADPAAFAEAVSEGMSHPAEFAARLFRLRASSLLGAQDPATARARLSGLLIGMELAAARRFWLGRQVVIVGETRLAERYAQALATLGVATAQLDPDKVTPAGLARARMGGSGTA